MHGRIANGRCAARAAGMRAMGSWAEGGIVVAGSDHPLRPLVFRAPRVAGIMNGKSPLTAVVLQTTATTELSVRKPQHPEQKLEGVAAVVLCQLFGCGL